MTAIFYGSIVVVGNVLEEGLSVPLSWTLSRDVGSAAEGGVYPSVCQSVDHVSHHVLSF